MLGAGMGGLGGGTAGLFGAEAAGAPLAASLMGPGAAIPSFTGTAAQAAAMPTMGGGTAAMFGSGMSPIPPGMGAPGGQSIPWGNILKGMGQAGQQMGGDQQPQAQHAQRPANNATITSNADVLRKMQELRSMPGRSNFAGLLGRFQ